jgi:hypothetical protein
VSSERLVRLLAGSLVLISLLLAHFHSQHWLWLTAFVGANLFQSALTRWCLAESIMVKLGAEPCAAMRRPESR